MKKTLLLLIISTIATGLWAQQFKSKLSESSMTIAGTSTLHDWESTVKEFTATAVLKGDVITSAQLTAVVKSIKSGTSAMDANTYEAMKEPKHPNITFRGTEMVLGSDGAKIKGDLTIAGVTRKIEFTAIAEKWSEDSFSIKGSYALKMSDYGIDPPRAMLGTIRTGDKVTISFNLVMYN